MKKELLKGAHNIFFLPCSLVICYTVYGDVIQVPSSGMLGHVAAVEL